MINERIISLLYKKLLELALTEEETNELEIWAGKSVHNQMIYDELKKEHIIEAEVKEMLLRDKEKEKAWGKLLQNIQFYKEQPPVRKLTGWWRYAAASVIIIMISLGGYVVFNNKKGEIIAKKDQQRIIEKDIPPGGYKATLTLADGTVIDLDKAQNGSLAQQNGSSIRKQATALIYDATGESSSNNHSTLSYNILTTPKQGQYKVMLPDGTQAWLNAVSSIRFPTAFTGDERKVEITGEVYFEVAKNKAKPFRVCVNGMQVEVVGTRFNINAYANEPLINTTLLEGSVKISEENKTELLKPGQQAQLTKTKDLKIVDNANLEQAVAWKAGTFYLTSADLETVMRQVERWYDIEVVYPNGVPKGIHLTGEAERSFNLSDMMKVLKLSGVNCKLEDKTLTILP